MALPLPGLFEHSLLIAGMWFLLYWVFGGVFFAAITILRVIKLRRGRFSCLFTILTAGFAYGAAYSGLAFGEMRIEACVRQANGFFETIAAVFGCGILEIMTAGLLWFLLLLVCGFAILMISRAENQSWVDSKKGLGDEEEGVVYLDEVKEHR